MYKIITIDGPAGVGKGTVSKRLSEALKARILNSGEIYRTIAYNISKNEINHKDRIGIINYLQDYKYVKISSDKLYNKEIDSITSEISSIPKLRKLIIGFQRNFIKSKDNANKYIIAEGRDMGTVIFPKAYVKIFLWANCETRAKRRYLQVKKSLKTRKFNDILNEIRTRDMKDMSRKTAPLQPAEDSYLIDNSNLDIEQSFNAILKIINKTNQ